MFSFVGETVFDPFAGSGTTSLAAKNLERNSIGYEINKDFATIINEKFNTSYPILNDYELRFYEDTLGIKQTVNDLPYIFKDPHKMDKKVDVKKLQFGSKIDNSEAKREDLFSVKNVISPNKIELNNGLVVKLLGVKENQEYNSQAIEFLKNKFKKRRVFIKYDNEKYDSNGELLCYVYLDNKTFINNHLIRTGFVQVDTEKEYSCKEKFLKSLPQ